MIYLQFLIGFVAYFSIAYASYSEFAKKSWWFFPLGIAVAVIANVTWLYISKAESNTSSLLVKGLWWDAMLTLTYVVVPLILFGAKLTLNQGIGMGLVLTGLLLTKF